MSIRHNCDGCGTDLENPVQVGYVLKRDYCEDCAEKAREYLHIEEALRVAAHDAFLTSKREVVEALSQGGFKLPDVPAQGDI